jgi:tetratricopeptide (TPR) repeat protein
MKTNTILRTIAVAAISTLLSLPATAQQLKTPAPSPMQTLDQAFALSNIKIEYSRPSVKGRVIFGDLVPFGSIWRTGANNSTKITFGEDVKIEGKDLKAGTYALYTIPNKDSWEIMFYSDVTLGGNVSDYNKEKEALRISVKSEMLASKMEMFTINVIEMTSNTAKVQLGWDKTGVSFSVVADIDTKIMKNIETTMAKDSRPYYAAANYYYENNKDLNKALEWVKVAVDQNPKAYWVSHLQAKIQYKLKDYPGAIATAEKSMAVAKEEQDDSYVNNNAKLIAEIKGAKK